MARYTLDEEALRWICTGLKSIAASRGRSPERKRYLTQLADRLAENKQGNPNMVIYGQRRAPGPTVSR